LATFLTFSQKYLWAKRAAAVWVFRDCSPL